MAEILLCNQATHINQLEALPGFSSNSITGLSCVNPDILNSYTPYITNQNLSPVDRDIMQFLSPMPVARQLTNLSLSYGEENTQALSAISAKLIDYNIGLIGASTSVYANRMGGFVGSVQKYQDALMQYRQAVKANHVTKTVAKQKAMSAFQSMQREFRHEINVVNAGVKSKKGTPLTSVTRGTNIARSSRNVAKLNVTDHIQANNLVKLSQYAKVLGNGLAVIDFSSRVGKVHNSYKAGDEWERDMFIESSSFAASAIAGSMAVKGGLSLLVFATPLGWAGLIIGGVAIAGVAAATSIGINNLTRESSGGWYDDIMAAIKAL